MTEQELEQLRRQKWHLDGHPVRTLDDARSFIESVGFCLMYPLRPPVLVPTFIGAYTGSNERLPTWQHAFADPRAQEATELMVRLLRDRAAYEANLFDENNNFLVAASVFPYFYALVGERNPRQAPKPGPRSEYSQLACDAFEVIRRTGPVSKQKLREVLGGSVSLAALDHALGELWSKLRITRVDYKPDEGSFWDVLYRWVPDAVREGIGISVGEALSALISKYLDCVIAADQQELENFFGNFVSRSRVKEAVNALLAARELSFIRVGHRSLIHITPPRIDPKSRGPEWRQASPKGSVPRRP
jgi:Winged helix DNA-binding domain